jgi:hypothetical protein
VVKPAHGFSVHYRKAPDGWRAVPDPIEALDSSTCRRIVAHNGRSEPGGSADRRPP